MAFVSPALTNSITGWSSNLTAAEYWLNPDGTINRANAILYTTDQHVILPGYGSLIPSIARSTSANLVSAINQEYSGGVYYYVAASGSDAAAGTSIATAWKTIDKVTNTTFSAGNTILFNRGDTFYGQLSLKGAGKSGTTANPITFGAFGTGANPIITGLSNVTGWASLGGNLWRTSAGVTPLSTINVAVINGTNTARGRWPKVTSDPHYRFDVDSYGTGNGLTNTVVSAQLTNSSYSPPTLIWTNAQICIWDSQYTVDKHTITNQTAGSLTFTGGDRALDKADGLFIQEDLRCCTSQDEWMWESGSKKMSIYSTYSPTNVYIATQNYNFLLDGNSNIVVNGLDFYGANGFISGGSSFGGIDMNSTHNIQLLNCGVKNQGHIGMRSHSNKNSDIRVENCIFDQCNQMGVVLSQTIGYTPFSTNAQFRYNRFTNIGMLPGMIEEGVVTGVQADGAGTTIEYNEFYNTGGFTIHWWGPGTQIHHNTITNFCMTTADNGAMYTYNSLGSPTNTPGVSIYNNVILHAGAAGSSRSGKHGIYFDWRGNGATVENNSIWDCGNGIYHHVTTNILVRGNNVYDCIKASYEANSSETWPGGIIITNNVFAQLTVGAGFAAQRSEYDSDIIPASNIYNWNCYGGITNESKTMNHTGVSGEESLAAFQAATGQALNSWKSPFAVNSSTTSKFIFNASDTNATFALSASTYVDNRTNAYLSSTVTLAPWTSITLWKP